VQMIRHQQENVRPPQKIILPVADGCKQGGGNFVRGQLVLAAFPAVDGDEINFLVRIHP